MCGVSTVRAQQGSQGRARSLLAEIRSPMTRVIKLTSCGAGAPLKSRYQPITVVVDSKESTRP